jgi:hypothetical protein
VLLLIDQSPGWPPRPFRMLGLGIGFG